jgi:hypothetical protein
VLGRLYDIQSFNRRFCYFNLSHCCLLFCSFMP